MEVKDNDISTEIQLKKEAYTVIESTRNVQFGLDSNKFWDDAKHIINEQNIRLGRAVKKLSNELIELNLSNTVFHSPDNIQKSCVQYNITQEIISETGWSQNCAECIIYML